MTKLTLVRPSPPASTLGPAPLATRVPVDEPVALLLVDNGKPRARDLLQAVGAGIAARLPVTTVDLHSKPSASKPIDADVARLMAARYRLVVTGVGD